jgi:hypothetical protein
MVLTTFPFQIESVKKAQFAPYLLLGARAISVVTPSSIKSKFMDEYQKVKQFWQEEIKNKAVTEGYGSFPPETERGGLTAGCLHLQRIYLPSFISI